MEYTGHELMYTLSGFCSLNLFVYEYGMFYKERCCSYCVSAGIPYGYRIFTSHRIEVPGITVYVAY